MALNRLGQVSVALVAQERFVRQQVAEEVSREVDAPVAPVVFLRGTVSSDLVRSTRSQMLGVDEAFWKLSPDPSSPVLSIPEDGAALGENLARRLKVKIGEEVLVRLDKPSLLSRDAPLSTIEDASIAFRAKVSDIVSDARFGGFSLAANQTPALNVFLPLRFVQSKIGMPGRTNVMLVGMRQPGAKSSDLVPKSEQASQALWKHWKLTDAGLSVHERSAVSRVELRTERVFLDPAAANAAQSSGLPNEPALTYFVNALEANGKLTPYSTVTATDHAPRGLKLNPDQIAINQWLATDLGAKVGDTISLRYWVVGDMRKLEEKSSTLTVAAVLPMEGDVVDPALMPDIPGLSDKKNCREWEPGVPIDLKLIRDKDQAYWDKYRGSPKAFIPLATGRRIWANRFGDTTTVRFPSDAASVAKVEMCLRQSLNPASLGLFFVSVRENGLSAGNPSLDFGFLFIGFSFFLIVAAMLLTALLFGFCVEQRATEAGLLLATGWRVSQVRRQFLMEGTVVAALGAITGAIFAAAYTSLVVAGLNSVWSGAVGGGSLKVNIAPVTLVLGTSISFLVAICSIWFVVRGCATGPIRAVLAGQASASAAQSHRKAARWHTFALIICLAGAIASVLAGLRSGMESAAELFFSGGALFLISGLLWSRRWLASKDKRSGSADLSLSEFSQRGVARRVGRSLAAICLLATGSFLVVAIGANKHDVAAGADKRESGTGGFALYGESAMPVFTDLNRPEGHEPFGLNDSELDQVSFVQMRLKEGDDASCLNLNRAQTPRLLGVNPDKLAERKAFTFVDEMKFDGSQGGWTLLNAKLPAGEVPVVGDTNTVKWSLGKGVGQTLDYRTERGELIKLRIVGTLASSVLQGGLILSEQTFKRLFPGSSGYQAFLIDAPTQRRDAVASVLGKALENEGLDIVPTVDRLQAFGTVESTYLNIFAALGGLGLLLGSAGLGVIVLRNVMDRRGELAILRAVGFRKAGIRQLVFREHRLLLVMGLLAGTTSAVIAVLPSLVKPGSNVPVGGLTLTILGVLVNGLLFTWLATTLALRGSLIGALRDE